MSDNDENEEKELEEMYQRFLKYEDRFNTLLWRSMKDAIVDIWRVITGKRVTR